MEPEGSLPQLQVPVTCPYPEPARSVHTPTSHLMEIHVNIILPSTPGTFKWPLSLRCHQQNPVYWALERYEPILSLTRNLAGLREKNVLHFKSFLTFR